MAKKIFTSNMIPELVYEVDGEDWLDGKTYVVCFQEMKDGNGDIYHLEVEYHKDENKFTYTRVYAYENLYNAPISVAFKNQFEEYIMQQVGELRNGSFINVQSVPLELKLEIPKETSVGELHEFLRSLKFEVAHTMTPKDEKKIRILEIKNKKL